MVKAQWLKRSSTNLEFKSCQLLGFFYLASQQPFILVSLIRSNKEVHHMGFYKMDCSLLMMLD